jgi:beta-galactosidase
MQVLGVWNEETDWLPRSHPRRVSARPEATQFGLGVEYSAQEICALVQLCGATALLDYAEDFYAGRPALTRNAFGKGTAYYQAARLVGSFLDDFYGALIAALDLPCALGSKLPPRVAVQRRTSDTNEYLFLQNFSDLERQLALPAPGYFNLIEQQQVSESIKLGAWGSTVLRRRR